MEGVALLAVSVMGVLGNLLLLGRLARLPRQRSLAILPWHYPMDYRCQSQCPVTHTCQCAVSRGCAPRDPHTSLLACLSAADLLVLVTTLARRAAPVHMSQGRPGLGHI